MGIRFDGAPVALRRITMIPGTMDMDKCSIACLKFIRPDIKCSAKTANSAGKRFLVVLRDEFWNVLSGNNIRAVVQCIEKGMSHVNIELCSERLNQPLSLDHNDRADFRPTELESISESIQKVGLKHCRTAALQVTKERKLIGKLLKPMSFFAWEHPKKAVKHLKHCPLLEHDSNLNLEYLNVAHPGTSQLTMKQVFLLTRRPLRGVASTEEEGGRPSVLLDRNSHIWFPFVEGKYELKITIKMNQENDTKKKSVKNTTKKLKQQQQQGENKEKGGMEEKQIEMTTMGATTTLETTTQTSTQTKHLRHSFNICNNNIGSKFGSIEWVLQHKILRRENFYPKDLFALKVWPSLLQNIFIAKFETITNNARNIADAMIPIELYKFFGKVDSLHVEAVLFVFKKYVYCQPLEAGFTLAAFIHGFVDAGQRIDDIHPKAGLLSKSYVNWPDNSEQQFNDITKILSLLRNMVPILHAKRMSMPTDLEFYTWWNTNGNDSIILLSLKEGWTAPPTDVMNCVADMVNHIERDFHEHCMQEAMEITTTSIVDSFFVCGVEYVLDVLMKERTQLLQKEMEEQQHQESKELRSVLRDLVRQVEAQSPEHAQRMVEAVTNELIDEIVRANERNEIKKKETFDIVEAVTYELVDKIVQQQAAKEAALKEGQSTFLKFETHVNESKRRGSENSDGIVRSQSLRSSDRHRRVTSFHRKTKKVELIHSISEGKTAQPVAAIAQPRKNMLRRATSLPRTKPKLIQKIAEGKMKR